jgi:predicted metal-dependent enzyme (double-stranded beta helix superfamily)
MNVFTTNIKDKNMKTQSNIEQKSSELSRRGMIRTLGLGLSFAALPSFMSSAMTEVPLDALDPGEFIIPVQERELIEMQKFVEDCIAANKESNAQDAVNEVLARAVSNHKNVLNAIGEPTEAGLKVFLRSKELTIFSAAWTPQMNLMPHNHHMWANIGIYTGREDNILWERTNEGLVAKTASCLFTGDATKLNTNAIHSVTNPLPRFTGGLHIYGGDFFATERSQWDPETLAEEPSNGDVIREIFRKANEQMKRMKND